MKDVLFALLATGNSTPFTDMLLLGYLLEDLYAGVCWLAAHDRHRFDIRRRL